MTLRLTCSVRYDVSGSKCGEPAVRAFWSRALHRLAYRCALHVHGPGLASRGGRGLWREVPLREAVVLEVMSR